MAITHFDCDFFRPTDLTLEFSSYVALNPNAAPGSLVVASASAVKDGIGSQVACKLSLEQFVEGVLGFYGSDSYNGEEISLELLEAAFRKANNSVYHFGHKLAAGGKMAASLFGLVVERNTAAAGRVGAWSAYLFRKGELFPFFEDSREASRKKEIDSYVGVNSLISVELASVPIQPSDVLVAFSEELSAGKEKRLKEVLMHLTPSVDSTCTTVIGDLFPEGPFPAFTMVTTAGPDTFYLRELAAGPR